MHFSGPTIFNPDGGQTARGFFANNVAHLQEITFGDKSSIDPRNQHLYHM
jgi:hypothetical protein